VSAIVVCDFLHDKLHKDLCHWLRIGVLFAFDEQQDLKVTFLLKLTLLRGFCPTSESMASSSKKPRTSARNPNLLNVVTASGASNNDLRRIIGALENEPAPSWKSLQRARKSRFESVMTKLSVATLDGGTWDWPLCQPNLLFATMVSESECLRSLVAAAIRASPCSREKPWSLVVGYDEFVPGNKLQLQPSRKSMNLSFSFLELGPE